MCYGLNVSVPQNSYAENLMSSVMALGGEDFWRWLDHERRAPINGISAHIKEVPERSLTLSPCEDIGRRQPSMNQDVGFHQHQICQHIDLVLSSLQNYEK